MEAVTEPAVEREAFRPFGPGLAVVGLVIYFGVQIVAGATVAFFGGVWFSLTHSAPMREFSEGVLVPFATVCGLLATAPALWLFVRRQFGTHWEASGGQMLGLQPFKARSMGVALAVGVCVAGAYVVAASWLMSNGHSPDHHSGPLSHMATGPSFGFGCWLVMLVLIAPPLEEAVFRGMLLGGLMTHLRPALSVVIVTSVFAACHYSEAIHFPLAFLTIGTVGGAAAVLRVRTGSIYPGMLLHLVYNGVLGLMVLLSRR